LWSTITLITVNDFGNKTVKSVLLMALRKGKYASVVDVGLSVVSPVVVSRKLSKIDLHILRNTIWDIISRMLILRIYFFSLENARIFANFKTWKAS